VPKSTFRSCFALPLATCHPDANFIIYSLPRRDNVVQKVWVFGWVGGLLYEWAENVGGFQPDRLLIPVGTGVGGKEHPTHPHCRLCNSFKVLFPPRG